VVVKVDVNPAHPFARLDGLVLFAGSIGDVPALNSAVIDPVNDLAYFGTNGRRPAT